MVTSESFLKPVAVARYTGISLEGVLDLIDQGELESENINGSTRVRKTEVDRWLDEEVSPEKLLQLAKKMDKLPHPEKISQVLDVDKDKVEESLEE